MRVLSFPGGHSASRPVLAVLLLVALLGCGGDGDTQPLTVAIISPTQKAYVRTSVSVQVVADGGTATTVELLKDGAPLAELVAPYEYTWDTSSVDEGTYALTARATRGKTSVTSEPLEVVVDRTPPTIESHHPAGPDEWDGAISFTASEPLAASSVSDANVRLVEDAVEIRKKLQLSADGKTVRVAVNQPLTLPSSMSLQLLPQVTDLAGNFLGDTVRAWTWEAPEWRLLGRTPAQPGHGAGLNLTSLVVDAEGQPIVSFEEVEDVPEGQPTSSEVAIARWNGGGWDRIPPPDVFGQGQLAVDGTGRLHLALATPQSLSVSHWSGSAWTPVAPPVTRQAPDIVDRTLRLALTPDGAPWVAWHLLQSVPMGGMGALHVLDNGVLRQEYTWNPARIDALALSPARVPWVVVSMRHRPPSTRLHVWSGTGFQEVGGSFTQAAGAYVNSIPALDLDFDAEGRAYIAWRDGTHLYLQRWDGRGWELLSRWDASGDSSFDDELALKVTPEGNAYIAWTYRQPLQPVRLRLDHWDGTMMRPLITHAPSERFGRVSLALDSMNRPVVAWVAPPPPGSHRPTVQVRANH